MRKIIAATNMTLDGFCDHTILIADEEIHQHYTDLLRSAGIILYGRITYGLMQYWQTVLENPTGVKTSDEFAVAIDRIPKLVFSRTLGKADLGWETASLATRNLEEEVKALKSSSGNDILVGSRSLIVALTKLNLIDEYQLCIHPVIGAGELPLFENVNDRRVLKLFKTKTFGSGAVTLYYQSARI